MCRIIGIGDASMTADGASAGISGALYHYEEASKDFKLLSAFAGHIPVDDIDDAEALVSVYVAHLMDNRFVFKKIRKSLNLGSLKEATTYSDRRDNKAITYRRYKEVYDKYEDSYNVRVEVRWEARSGELLRRFDSRAKWARTLPIGLCHQRNIGDGENKPCQFTWDFANATFDQISKRDS